MKDGLDLGIISSGALMKKGYSFLIANVGKAVAIITLFVTALVSFTEISFSDFGGESFTTTLIMMLLASYIMYFSLEDAGEKLGRDSDGYKSVADKYEVVRSKISGADITALRQFCLDYRNADLEYRRSDMLFSLGYTNEEYARYLNGEILSKKAEKALRRVKKIKRAELDAAGLLSKGFKSDGELRDPKSSRIINMIIRLIPSTVCMIFTVSVMINARDNMTAAGVIESILKLSTLPVIGLRGYADGYNLATVTEVSRLRMRIRLLGAFLKKYGEN